MARHDTSQAPEVWWRQDVGRLGSSFLWTLVAWAELGIEDCVERFLDDILKGTCHLCVRNYVLLRLERDLSWNDVANIQKVRPGLVPLICIIIWGKAIQPCKEIARKELLNNLTFLCRRSTSLNRLHRSSASTTLQQPSIHFRQVQSYRAMYLVHMCIA